MKISLRKALEVSGLSEAKILAGEEKLDDVFIDSVTTIEVTDDTIGDWIEENQLCISAMYAIRDNLEQQLNLVRILHERKCARIDHLPCGDLDQRTGEGTSRIVSGIVSSIDQTSKEYQLLRYLKSADLLSDGGQSKRGVLWRA